MNPLSRKIEALLFWKAEPLSKKELLKYLKCTDAELNEAITVLDQSLHDRGIVLMQKEEELALGTANEMSAMIEQIAKEELNRDLGKAGIETLSIILYFGPMSRAEIDYIRGVNSTFTLRTLLLRGLIERVVNKNDQRSFLYKTTFDLLSHLGIKKLSDLPEYETAKAELEAFRKAQSEADAAQEASA